MVTALTERLRRFWKRLTTVENAPPDGMERERAADTGLIKDLPPGGGISP